MDMENGRCPYHSEPAKLEIRPWRKHTWRESGGNHCFPIGGSASNSFEPTRPYYQVYCTSCGAAGYASPSREVAKLAWRSLCNAADIANDVAEEMGVNIRDSIADIIAELGLKRLAKAVATREE